MGAKLDNAVGLYMDGIRDGHPREAVERYTGARYTQHSTGVKDGREGFVEFFTEFLERNPERDIRVVRGWEDGRYVFVHVYQELGGGAYRYLTTDFFDTEADDKIVEHWDVIAECRGANASGHTEVDGPTEIVDLDRTDANKALVREMLETCLFTGADGARVGEFVAEGYVEHSAGGADGLEAFAKRAQGSPRALEYEEIVLCVGSGNFVATLCRASREGAALCLVDIFRAAEGKIVEHWENSEPVPAESVNVGKF